MEKTRGVPHVERANAKLTLSTGTYYFESLKFEPSSEIRLNKSSGPIYVYVLNTFIHRDELHSLTAGVGPLWQKVALWRPAAVVFIDHRVASIAAGRPLDADHDALDDIARLNVAAGNRPAPNEPAHGDDPRGRRCGGTGRPGFGFRASGAADQSSR